VANPTAATAPEGTATQTAAAPQPPEATETPVESPLYGICYLSSAPDKPPFVEVGQSAKAGDTLCLVEAMKVLNAIHAPRDGKVAAIVAPDGEEVEQGQTLMVLS
jgi:acetyl-CoA carboxylase biotin carboxyl carrier protein